MKSTKITALTGFSKQSNADIVSRATAVYTKLPVNFPNAPVDMATLKAGSEKLSALMAEALDGSKKVIAERNKQRNVVIKMLLLLARYVEIESHEDIALFKSSGFDPATTTKTASPSLSEKIRKIEHGAISGQTLVRLQAKPEAYSYELRYAAVGPGSLAGDWISKPVTKVRGAVTIDGLTPGVTYLFQARFLADGGFTDWSDSVTFICT